MCACVCVCASVCVCVCVFVCEGKPRWKKTTILVLVDSLKIQKSKYLENGTLFLRMKKNNSLYTNSYNIAKNVFSGGNV